MKLLITIILFQFSIASAFAKDAADVRSIKPSSTKPIFSDLKLLQSSGAQILYRDEATQVGYAEVTSEQESQISHSAHEWGRCGGYEALPQESLPSRAAISKELEALKILQQKNQSYQKKPSSRISLAKNPVIENAIKQVDAEKIREWVQWLSNYPTRFNQGAEPNKHVDDLKVKIEEMLSKSKIPATVELVAHKRTPQKSIRVRLTGSQRPEEIVVLGGHLDSINHEWSGSKKAPGADDNASGSANLLEALRILLMGAQPERTIEMMWYAGEESGLLGSAEIAEAYKNEKKNVIGVLQLDMTMFPGSGELVIASITDFTSAWLRELMVELNRLYINAKIVEDACGYGCSDHASWYRKGFPTLLPFESMSDEMNQNLHTQKDLIDGKSNFNHAAAFTKIALAFGIELANSKIQQPY